MNQCSSLVGSYQILGNGYGSPEDLEWHELKQYEAISCTMQFNFCFSRLPKQSLVAPGDLVDQPDIAAQAELVHSACCTVPALLPMLRETTFHCEGSCRSYLASVSPCHNCLTQRQHWQRTSDRSGDQTARTASRLPRC